MNTDDLVEGAKKAKEKATFGSCVLGCLAIIGIWTGMCAGTVVLLYLAAWAISAGWRAGIGG